MSNAYDKFMKSMNIGYEEWHDGIGYDLDALRELDQSEIQQVESVLIPRKDEDWRDAEALAALGTPAALAALRSCVDSPNNEVRLLAARHLAGTGDQDELERVIIESLRSSTIGGGMVQALQQAEEHPSEAVKQTLFWCALHGHDDIRVHAAALLFYLYGVGESNFDWNHRPLFLRFNTPDMTERKAAFRDLCAALKIDPTPWLG